MQHKPDVTRREETAEITPVKLPADFSTQPFEAKLKVLNALTTPDSFNVSLSDQEMSALNDISKVKLVREFPLYAGKLELLERYWPPAQKKIFYLQHAMMVDRFFSFPINDRNPDPHFLEQQKNNPLPALLRNLFGEIRQGNWQSISNAANEILINLPKSKLDFDRIIEQCNDIEGKSPLDWLIQLNRQPILDELYTRSKKEMQDNIKYNQQEIIKNLLNTKKFPLNVINNFAKLAVVYGNLELIKLFKEYGADLHQQFEIDDQFYTAKERFPKGSKGNLLYLAANLKRDVNIVDYLLSQDPPFTTQEKNIALEEAKYNYDVRITQRLLSEGASILSDQFTFPGSNLFLAHDFYEYLRHRTKAESWQEGFFNAVAYDYTPSKVGVNLDVTREYFINGPHFRSHSLLPLFRMLIPSLNLENYNTRLGDVMCRAIENKEIEFFEFMTSLGVNVNQPGKDNLLPIDTATRTQEQVFIKRLLAEDVLLGNCGLHNLEKFESLKKDKEKEINIHKEFDSIIQKSKDSTIREKAIALYQWYSGLGGLFSMHSFHNKDIAKDIVAELRGISDEDFNKKTLKLIINRCVKKHNADIKKFGHFSEIKKFIFQLMDQQSLKNNIWQEYETALKNTPTTANTPKEKALALCDYLELYKGISMGLEVPKKLKKILQSIPEKEFNKATLNDVFKKVLIEDAERQNNPSYLYLKELQQFVNHLLDKPLIPQKK